MTSSYATSDDKLGIMKTRVSILLWQSPIPQVTTKLASWQFKVFNVLFLEKQSDHRRTSHVEQFLMGIHPHVWYKSIALCYSNLYLLSCRGLGSHSPRIDARQCNHQLACSWPGCWNGRTQHWNQVPTIMATGLKCSKHATFLECLFIHDEDPGMVFFRSEGAVKECFRWRFNNQLIIPSGWTPSI